MRIKPEAVDAFHEQMAIKQPSLIAAGWQSTTIYRSDTDPTEVWVAVVFESEEAYRKNAASPEQNELYQQMRALLDADPEWHDGEVVISTPGSPDDLDMQLPPEIREP